jgi:S1-C subfamily serine protease
MGNGILESVMLPGCSARIDIDGAPCGTGFFVTAKDLITCQHVIDSAARIEVRDCFGNRHPVRETPVVGDGLDLAWVKLETSDTSVPVALLGASAATGSELYSFGYPEGSAGEPATFEVEGLTGDVPPRLKFKDGQVKPGMSGSPLLDMRTGVVCAVLISTRGRQSSLGGYGVPVSAMLSSPAFRELRTLNESAHAADQRWMNALTADQEKASARDDGPEPPAGITITQVSGNARVGKVVNIGDVSGPLTF